jgi:hypothetical protein
MGSRILARGFESSCSGWNRPSGSGVGMRAMGHEKRRVGFGSLADEGQVPPLWTDGLVVLLKRADRVTEQHFFSPGRLGALAGAFLLLPVVLSAVGAYLLFKVASSGNLPMSWAVSPSVAARSAESGAADGRAYPVGMDALPIARQSVSPRLSVTAGQAPGASTASSGAASVTESAEILPSPPPLSPVPQTGVRVRSYDQNRGVLKLALTNRDTRRETFGTLRAVPAQGPGAGALLDPERVRAIAFLRFRTSFALSRSDTVLVESDAIKRGAVVLILQELSGLYQALVRFSDGRPMSGQQSVRIGFPDLVWSPVAQAASALAEGKDTAATAVGGRVP